MDNAKPVPRKWKEILKTQAEIAECAFAMRNLELQMKPSA